MNQEELIKAIHDRMDAAVKAASEESAKEIEGLRELLQPQKLVELVSTHLDGLDDNDPIVRKMRFGKPDEEDAFKGSKFARFGMTAADVEFLHDIKTAQAEAGRGKGPSEELDKAFKAVSPATRAMDTQESGYGQQLIGAQYVGDLWEAARNDSRIATLINSFEMSDATAYLPVEVDIPEMLLVSESQTNNASNYPTSKTGSNRVQVDAKKFVIHQMWSAEMEEDSIIPFVPFLRRQASIALAHYLDSVILNGDTTNAATGNINSDDEDPADTKHYLAVDGLRHVGLVDNTDNQDDVAAAVTFADLMAAKGRMVDYANLHDWGHPTSATDLVYLADPATADTVALLDEVKDSRIHNGGRDLLSGEVAQILGHPFISTIAMPKTEADGKVSDDTPANNTKGTIVAFNRRGYVQGWRRRVKLATEFLPATDQMRIVYSLRWGFGRFSPTGAASGIESADVLFDITV